MSLIKRTTKEIIKKKLIEHPQLRDSDEQLMLSIWRDALLQLTGKTKPEELSWMDFRSHLSNRRLPSASSIIRCRSKLQEERADLRGKLYNRRHELDDEVRVEIINFEP